MNTNFKKAWGWFCGIAGPPVAVLSPYIALCFCSFPIEAMGGALLALLVGIGLDNSLRPQDHVDPREGNP